MKTEESNKLKDEIEGLKRENKMLKTAQGNLLIELKGWKDRHKISKIKIFNDELEYLGKRVVHYEAHSEIPYVLFGRERVAVEEDFTEETGHYAVLDYFLNMDDD